MASTIDKSLNPVLKNYLTPFLKEKGFKKNRYVYRLTLNHLDWLIDIQKSQWNDDVKGEFTMNAGVYIPGIVSTYLNRPNPKNPGLTDCCISSRVGSLSEDRLDAWWTLSVQNEGLTQVKNIGEDIQSRVENHVLPFLKRFEMVKDVAGFLENPREREDRLIMPRSETICLAYAGICHLQLNQTEKGEILLKKAEEMSKKTPISAIIKSLRSRLCSRD